MNPPFSSAGPWPHRLACLLAGCSLLLIFIGGLVTSTQSGLAVPDWPLSYGRLMPPMRRGILFEHGHRMAAGAVGILTVFLAVIFQWKEPRPGIRRAAWTALGLVIIQGVLGGLTVLFRLPKPISIAHGCLAQTFFCLTAALAVWTSPRWREASSLAGDPENATPLHQLAAGLCAAAYVQLILGAVLRHTGWGFPLHAAGAFAVTAFAFWIFGRILRMHRPPREISFLSGAVLGAVILQLVLGLSSYILLSRGAGGPVLSVAVITSHVAVGAALLGLSFVLALWAWRVRPSAVPASPTKLSDYFTLTKPGISFMSGVTALAGFVLGSQGALNTTRLIHTVIGTCLVSPGACALNMLLEIDVDARMHRTEKRPLPSGRLKPGEVLLFGVLLATAGVLYLCVSVNPLTALLAGVTLGVYLYLYTPLKKITALCTTVGAVAGALPPVMGWTAAAGSLGPKAWALFAILFFWQFPHFLALAWMYKDDYARAGLSMLPDLGPEGDGTASKIVLNSFALLGASLLPTLLGLTGPVYLGAALFLGAGLMVMGWMFFQERSLLRARRLFLASVLYIPLLMIFMVLNKLPSFL